VANIDRLKSLALAGKLSRREFIVGAIAAGVTATAASSMFTEIARAEPKAGGKLRVGLGHGATTDSLDPATYPDAFTGTCCWGSMSNSLTEIDAKGNVTPDLAESFEGADGNTKWVFKIRSGVTFHNGKSVTAEDVVGSIRHHMGEGTKSAAKSILAAITDVKADGSNVVFTLSGGNGDFPALMSDYHLVVMPVADGKADWQSGVRTGPYTLQKWEPGVRAELKRNPNYYRQSWFDEVSFTTIADVAARTNALTSGEIDYMDRCDLKTVGLLKQNPDVEVDAVTGFGHYVFVMNVTQQPFDKVEVRQALKYAIDREAIAKKVFLGYAQPGNDSPLAPSIKFATNPEPVYSYNPDKAKELLKKAGVENLTVELSAADSAFAGAVDAAQLFADSAAAAGITVKVVKEAADSYWDVVWMKKPFVASYWGGRPTADWMFTTAYAADAAWNDTSWKHPRFNELLIAARSEADEAKRAAMYAEMQQILHDDGGLLNIVFNQYVEAHTKKLAHGELASNWALDGMKIAQRWWFA
jgi:peptide/nickel transport system substrate-binding protein